MAGRLAGKVAVITGGGSGMGKSMAEMFAAEGAKVVCGDVSGKQDDVARTIGAAAVGVHADVSQAADIERLVATAEERFGRVDIMVNNAGIGSFGGPLHEQEEATFDRIIAVNLKGVFLGMKYGIASMLKTGGGSVVNISSTAGLVGTPGLACYSASKGGVVQLTRVAAMDYAQQNVRVNAICPGLVWSTMMPWSDGSLEPPPGTELSVPTPMGRWGKTTEIAAAALFLASDEAAFVTGTIMPVDGGLTAT